MFTTLWYQETPRHRSVDYACVCAAADASKGKFCFLHVYIYARAPSFNLRSKLQSPPTRSKYVSPSLCFSHYSGENSSIDSNMPLIVLAILYPESLLYSNGANVNQEEEKDVYIYARCVMEWQ